MIGRYYKEDRTLWWRGAGDIGKFVKRLVEAAEQSGMDIRAHKLAVM